jgi:hypothetical protein
MMNGPGQRAEVARRGPPQRSLEELVDVARLIGVSWARNGSRAALPARREASEAPR